MTAIAVTLEMVMVPGEQRAELCCLLCGKRFWDTFEVNDLGSVELSNYLDPLIARLPEAWQSDARRFERAARKRLELDRSKSGG